jgi:hypothetical protein
MRNYAYTTSPVNQSIWNEQPMPNSLDDTDVG